MTSGLDNLSLALFTALAPAGVVAFIIMALARLFAIDHERAVRIDRMIALPFAVALVGFIASATHLGTPANALHVFSGVGTSPLSNEVLAAVMFLFLAGSYWMVAFKVNFPDAAAKPWLLVACLAGIALLGVHLPSLRRAHRAHLEHTLFTGEPFAHGLIRGDRAKPAASCRCESTPITMELSPCGPGGGEPCCRRRLHARPERLSGLNRQQ